MKVFILCGEGATFLSGTVVTGPTDAKALRLVCGRPLVEYAILEAMKIKDVVSITLVILSKHAGVFQTWLDGFNKELPESKVQLVVQPDTIELGSTAALVASMVGPSSSSDYTVVMPSDIIGGLDLQTASMELEAMTNTVSAMTYISNTDAFCSSRRATFGKSGPEKTPLWLVSSSKNMTPGLEDIRGYKLEKEIVNNEVGSFNCIVQQTEDNLHLIRGCSDLGVHFINDRILYRLSHPTNAEFWEELVQVPAPQNLNELLAFLVNMQNSNLMRIVSGSPKESWKDEIMKMKNAAEKLHQTSEAVQVIGKMITQDENTHKVFRISNMDHFFTVQGILCNPVPLVLSRTIPNHLHPKNRASERPKALKDSFVAAGTSLEDLTKYFEGKALAQRSVFHGPCRVANQSKVIECEIHPNVSIEKGCKLERCVIAEGVSIPAKVTMKNCVVMNGAILETNGEYENQRLGGVQEEQDCFTFA